MRPVDDYHRAHQQTLAILGNVLSREANPCTGEALQCLTAWVNLDIPLVGIYF